MGRIHFRLATAILLALCALTPSTALAQSATAPSTLLTAINDVRASHGLPAVQEIDSLDHAATAHTVDMMRRDYFLHESGPGGEAFDARILHYWRPGPDARLGEVLAWGTGSLGGAHSAVARWMQSPPHRAVLMSPMFTRVGIGVDEGHFLGYSGAVVWTADFARP